MFDKKKIAELYPGAEDLMIPPMKYYAPSKEKLNKAYLDESKYFAQEKKDGALYMAVITDKGNYLFSRTPSKKTGLLVDKAENVPHIMNMLNILPPRTVLLGEIFYPNKTSKDVTSIMGCLPTKAKERQNGEYGYISYYVHDILWYDGIDLISGGATNWERYAILKDIWHKHHIEHPNIILASIYEHDFSSVVAQVLAEGGEGLVLKERNATYEPDKRPQTNFKVKTVDYIDAICTGTVDATRDYTGKELDSWTYWEYCSPQTNKWEKIKGIFAENYKESPDQYRPVTKAYFNGWKTAISIGLYNSKNEIEEIGTVASGLTDELRADLAEHPENYIGKIVSIQAMSKDKKEHTLRHPFIVQFRDDKPAEDCTITTVFTE